MSCRFIKALPLATLVATVAVACLVVTMQRETVVAARSHGMPDRPGLVAETAEAVVPQWGPPREGPVEPTEPTKEAPKPVDLQVGAQVLNALVGAVPEPAARYEATTRLVSLLRSDADLVALLTARIVEGACTPIEEGRLLECLARAGSAASQQAILEVLQSPRSNLSRRRQAVRSLAAVEDPLPDVEATLARHVDEWGPLAGSCAVTLAVLGRRMREVAPARHHGAVERVLAFLDSAASHGQWQLALEAAGQVGLRELPDRVVEAVRASDPDVRASALRAVGRIEVPEADSHLLWSMRDDPVEGVRRVAVDAYAARHRNEIRSAPAEGDSPRATLESVAQTDLSPRVRELAGELLDTVAN